MLKLTVDLWNSSLQVKSFLCDNLTGRYRELPIVFDTGAYITVVDTHTLVRAGYNVNRARNTEVNVVGYKNVPAREITVNGLMLGDKLEEAMALGPVLVYAIDMSNMETTAVLGLNVIREFETRIKFGVNSTIELIPMFDLDDIVQHQNFIVAESRFGHWSPGQE